MNDRARKSMLLALLSVAAITLLSGCAGDPERERARGWKAGYEDGHRAGEREGYERGFTRAFEDSFGQRVDAAPKRGLVRKNPVLLVLLIAGFLLLGFFAQYSFLYLLRRGRLLRDVDSILLGPADASLTLKSLNPDRTLSPLLRDESEDSAS